MQIDAWLPIGYELPNGTVVGRTLTGGTRWQIAAAEGGGRVLIAHPELLERWSAAGLIQARTFGDLLFGDIRLYYLVSGPEHVLCAVADGVSPSSKSEAMAFAAALRSSRARDGLTAFQDALYVEKLTRLLPTYSISAKTGDDVVLGYWLTGGAPISATAFRRLHQTISWLGIEDLADVVESAGIPVEELVRRGNDGEPLGRREKAGGAGSGAPPGEKYSESFELPGRPALTAFINEHVVDVLRHRERYAALGIGFPAAIVLHGPPGSGKTYAVERLVEYLGWPSYPIDASSIASPYIHETSRKVAEVFDAAQQNAPAVLIIDEMEAFLADREIGAGHHRVEEVAEFLRRIPEATKNDVLVIGMTNRIELIDDAILRRGRFDHVIHVGYASKEEVQALLGKLLASLPTDGDVDTDFLAGELAGRPLSDVAFIMREGARLAARSGRERLDQASLMAALHAASSRDKDVGSRARVGFI